MNLKNVSLHRGFCDSFTLRQNHVKPGRGLEVSEAPENMPQLIEGVINEPIMLGYKKKKKKLPTCVQNFPALHSVCRLYVRSFRTRKEEEKFG